MNPIEIVASGLQALPPELRWLSAQQDVIMSAGELPPRGRGGLWADRIVAWAASVRLDRSTVAAITLVLSVQVFLRQFSSKLILTPDAALFIGIRALREPPLVAKFEEICCRSAIQLDERDLSTFFAVQRVGLTAMVAEWVKLWWEIWSALGQSSSGGGLHKRLQLSYLLRAGHKFVYFRAWFREYVRRRDCDLPIGFSAASYTAYAAIAAGAKAIYFEHGFQRRSIVYPDFAEAYCFNQVDAAHIQLRLPRVKVISSAACVRFLETRRLVGIAGIYGPKEKFDLFDRCRSAIEWAQKCQVPVVIRPHPADRSDYWTRWRGAAGVEFVDESCEFEVFLATIRPRFLVSWYSTVFFDALKMGVVPVTLSGNAIESRDVVFPFSGVALRWPEDEVELHRLLDDPQACAESITRKYCDATGMSMDGSRLAE